jgi:hypothetical protein
MKRETMLFIDRLKVQIKFLLICLVLDTVGVW